MRRVKNGLLIKIANSKRHTEILKIISKISALACSAIFIAQLAVLAFSGDYFTAVKIAASAAVGFVIVTVMRHFINAPRPYELRSFYKVSPRDKVGKSFPSRHAYSAFVIATLSWLWHPLIAVGTGIIALVVCAARVLVGIHFIRDVVCGALLGILAGVLGILLIL